MSDPTLEEMREFLHDRYKNLTDLEPKGSDFSVEEAIYWFASNWHGGQWSNLYSALSTSEYRPGRNQNGIEPGDYAELMYADLEAEYTQEKVS